MPAPLLSLAWKVNGSEQYDCMLSDALHPSAVNQGGPARYGTGNQGNLPAENDAAPAASGVYGVNPASRGPYGGPAGGAGYGVPLQNQGA